MPDPRLRPLDALGAPPDIWARAQRMVPRPPEDEGPSGARRLGIVVLAFVVAAAGIGLAVRAFRPGPSPVVPVAPSPMANGKLAYVRGTISILAGSGVVVIANGDGSSPEAIEGSRGSLTALAWSPDGTRLAYVTSNGEFGGGTIVVVDANGEHPTTVLDTRDYLTGLSWAPDGRSLVIGRGTAHEQGGIETKDYHLELLSLDGDGDRLSGAAGVVGPAWSPDGASIAYGSMNAWGGGWRIGTMSSDGSGAHLLTSGPTDQMPAWSPDAQWIAFLSGAPDPDRIEIMRPDGSDRHTVYECPSSCNGPLSWSPDGAWISFTAWDPGRQEGYATVLSTDDWTARTLVDAPSVALAWQPIPQ